MSDQAAKWLLASDICSIVAVFVSYGLMSGVSHVDNRRAVALFLSDFGGTLAFLNCGCGIILVLVREPRGIDKATYVALGLAFLSLGTWIGAPLLWQAIY